jgi:hypothetical protein
LASVGRSIGGIAHLQISNGGFGVVDAGFLHVLILYDQVLPVSGQGGLPGNGLTVVGESVR